MAKKVVKSNTVNEEPTKRKPLERIPVQTGTGKTFQKRENKKPRLFNHIPKPQRRVLLMTAGVLVTSCMAQMLYFFVLKNDREDHEKAENEVFDVVSSNCSSLGVNKMAIVDKVSKMIRKERLNKKSANRRVEELEKFILNYNSVSKEEMEDMLQQIKTTKNGNND